MKMQDDAKPCSHGHSFGVPNTSLFSVEPRWYPPVPMLYAERSAACRRSRAKRSRWDREFGSVPAGTDPGGAILAARSSLIFVLRS